MAEGVKRRNVVVILGIMVLAAGFLVSGVMRIQEKASRAKCVNNLKQFGLAFHGHHDTTGVLPPGYITTPSKLTANFAPGWAWNALLLNFLEASNWWADTQRDLPVETRENNRLRTWPIASFRCPADQPPSTFTLYRRTANGDPLAPICDIAASNYVGVCGTTEPHAEGDGVLFRDSKVKLQDIIDGTSNTLLVGERSFRTGESTWVGAVAGAGHVPPPGSGFPMAVGDSASFVLGTVGGMEGVTQPRQANHFSGNHRGGLNFLLCDGSVRFLTADVSGDVLRAMATRAGKDDVGEN